MAHGGNEFGGLKVEHDWIGDNNFMIKLRQNIEAHNGDCAKIINAVGGGALIVLPVAGGYPRTFASVGSLWFTNNKWRIGYYKC